MPQTGRYNGGWVGSKPYRSPLTSRADTRDKVNMEVTPYLMQRETAGEMERDIKRVQSLKTVKSAILQYATNAASDNVSQCYKLNKGRYEKIHFWKKI